MTMHGFPSKEWANTDHVYHNIIYNVNEAKCLGPKALEFGSQGVTTVLYHKSQLGVQERIQQTYAQGPANMCIAM